jgi:hypothetical protein
MAEGFFFIPPLLASRLDSSYTGHMPLTFDESHNQIAELVKHFRTNFNVYHTPGYKEAHARQEFIDPMFMALDWDVHNTQHATPIDTSELPSSARRLE